MHTQLNEIRKQLAQAIKEKRAGEVLSANSQKQSQAPSVETRNV